jgi:uncharacterized protein Yka (UPF0111/DUF47 family)
MRCHLLLTLLKLETEADMFRRKITEQLSSQFLCMLQCRVL